MTETLIDTIRRCAKPGIMTDARICLAAEAQTLSFVGSHTDFMVRHTTINLLNWPNIVLHIGPSFFNYTVTDRDNCS